LRSAPAEAFTGVQTGDSLHKGGAMHALLFDRRKALEALR
jgi:hypothetical protein